VFVPGSATKQETFCDVSFGCEYTLHSSCPVNALQTSSMKHCLSFYIISTFLVDAATRVASFSPPNVALLSQINSRQRSTIVLSLFQDDLKKLFFANQREIGEESSASNSTSSSKDGTGTVFRLAARAYSAESSKPSSRDYTTRKTKFQSVQVTKEGVKGDYNHYRTVALKSTKDRAVSILTQDVMKSLRATYKNYDTKDGDLGENILVTGVPFDFFRIGQRYQFSCPDDDAGAEKAVIVEITEPMEPCANLCKLTYINDPNINPRDRIERCQDFLGFLNRFDGYRGWYAKVHRDGVIATGAIVSLVNDTDACQ
jgi:MOSC domain-containing protein YiiM